MQCSDQRHHSPSHPTITQASTGNSMDKLNLMSLPLLAATPYKLTLSQSSCHNRPCTTNKTLLVRNLCDKHRCFASSSKVVRIQVGGQSHCHELELCHNATARQEWPLLRAPSLPLYLSITCQPRYLPDVPMAHNNQHVPGLVETTPSPDQAHSLMG